jgi:hypothetical protein
LTFSGLHSIISQKTQLSIFIMLSKNNVQCECVHIPCSSSPSHH